MTGVQTCALPIWIEVKGSDGKLVTANTRDGVAVVDQDEIELKALEDAEIVLVETDQIN